jgi:DNA topoisomerase-3
MGKILIIAEKPSVMTDLSRALSKPLGKFEKEGTGRETWFENDRAIITSAVGHLIELRMPTGPNGKNLPWKFDVLPAIPPQFELDPIADSEPRLRQVLKLAKRKDVSEIINACDAGREGELIFQYIMEYGKVDKPVKRLWMQSMTQGAILEAWDNLRPAASMKNLADAAKCRSEADWLVGLNSTRALTCFRSRHGGFNITAAGRVQTPTLSILAQREAEIQAFVPQAYWEVSAVFQVAKGQYPATWIDETWKKDESKPHGKAERIWNAQEAEEIKQRCLDKTGTVTEETKPQTQIAPQLYDLTSLQRDASSRLGLSAKATLQIAQALYEKHKMLTYPRTDSKYLPEDYLGTVRTTLGEIADGFAPLAPYARAVLQGKEPNGPQLVKTRRVFDDKKVSDHFAIIPTGAFSKLNDLEAKVYDLVAKRFIAVFYPAAEFELTRRLTRIVHNNDLTDTFQTNGKVLVKPGWMEVYGRRIGVAANKDELVAISIGEKASAIEVEVKADTTKPPARFNEATLLSAMEGAGKLVDDEALAEAMSERGLGTPATRAAIIEGLISQKYLARDGRDLHVTPNGMTLIRLVREMEIDGLSSPALTGEWEYKLRQMEQGELSRDLFMSEIESYTREIVERARTHAEASKGRTFDDLLAPCPRCGATELKQTDATYECRAPGCHFSFKKHIAARELSMDEARELLSKGIVGPLSGFKSRFNRPFDAWLKLDEKQRINFHFDNEDTDARVELTEEMLIGNATLPNGSQAKVYQTEKAYYVPAIVTPTDKDGLRIGRSILQKELPAEEILKLLSEGRTNLLKGFVSNRTKRRFDAYLTLDPSSYKINFDFPEREPRIPKTGDGTAPVAAKKTAKKSAQQPAKKTAKKVAKKAAKKSAKKPTEE